MKKNQGFTLIELLAVVVILAVIALISVPLIMNVIDGARKGALQNTAYGIAEAGKYAFTNEVIKDGSAGFTAYIYEDGVESSSPTGKSLNYKGEKPKTGTILINSKGDIALAVYNGKYCAEKGFDDVEVTVSEKVEADCVLVEDLTEVEVLVVAGGGGGGRGSGGNAGGSGGGAGGLIYNTNYAVIAGGQIDVVVGTGGLGVPTGPNDAAIGGKGGNSSFGTIITTGGGGGVSFDTISKSSVMDGGSGGGGHVRTLPYATGYGLGITDQGYNGGQITSGTGGYGGGCGGGGAGGTGANGIAAASSNATSRPGRAGGLGLLVMGSYYAGGGAGGGDGTSLLTEKALGGSGVGGNGGTGTTDKILATDGAPNTGSGGGGGGASGVPTNGGGNGGSGVVIVRYFGPQKAQGGAITTVDGYTIHTFTSGTATFSVMDF